MYQTHYSTKNYFAVDYNKFVKKTLERLTAHLGNYSGGYIPRQNKKIDYESS